MSSYCSSGLFRLRAAASIPKLCNWAQDSTMQKVPAFPHVCRDKANDDVDTKEGKQAQRAKGNICACARHYRNGEWVRGLSANVFVQAGLVNIVSNTDSDPLSVP